MKHKTPEANITQQSVPFYTSCTRRCYYVGFHYRWASDPTVSRKKEAITELTSGLAGIGRTHLSAIERGERKPTLDTFFKIADALNVKPSFLMAAIEDSISKE